jgi:hypothetical protein
MRIWSIHPKYLDSTGIVALWREALLAKSVLEGKTTGYRNHPQIDRFRNSKKPVEAINQYLSYIYDESVERHFHFNTTKFRKPAVPVSLTVSEGQLKYEFGHLLGKLKRREINLYKTLEKTTAIIPHPMFKQVKGEIENWERVK